MDLGHTISLVDPAAAGPLPERASAAYYVDAYGQLPDRYRRATLSLFSQLQKTFASTPGLRY
jgi:hypothetical protein